MPFALSSAVSLADSSAARRAPPFLVLPCLKVLDSGKHVKMPCRILFNHVLHVIRPQSLLELFFIETKL